MNNFCKHSEFTPNFSCHEMAEFEKTLQGGIMDQTNIQSLHLNNNEELINSGVNLGNNQPLEQCANDLSNRDFLFQSNSIKEKSIISKETPQANQDKSKYEFINDNSKKSIFFFFGKSMNMSFSKKEKIMFYFTHYVLVHTIVIIITIILQYLFWLNFIIIMVYKSVIQVLFESSTCRIISFTVFYGICFLYGFGYYFQEQYLDEEGVIQVIIPLFPLIFQIKVLCNMNFKIIDWLKHIIKINVTFLFGYLNYFFCFYIMPEINEILKSQFDAHLARNLVKIYQWIYFSTSFNISWRLIKIYNKHILSFAFNDVSPTICLLRYISMQLVSIPIIGILGAKDFDDWISYFLLISYSLFIFKTYTKIDIIFMVLKKIYYILRPNKIINNSKQKVDQNEILCSKLLSGCLLDLVVIINSRLFILIATNRWYTEPLSKFMYSNCNFEISDSFNLAL